MILYDTLSQYIFIFALLLAGFICGFGVDIKKATIKKIKKTKILSNIFDFFIILISFCSLFLTNLFFHYGIIRLFPFAVFLLGFASQRLFSQKVVAKIIPLCYNFLKGKSRGKEKS